MQLSFISRNRNPFKVLRLPLLAKLYLLGYRKQRGAYKTLIGKPAKSLFKFLHKVVGLNGTGAMSINNGEEIPFDARNTQFHAIYLPQYINNYETEVSGLIDLLLPDNGTFIDAGANWGYFSLYAASKKGFQGNIHAFEPVEATFNSLTKTVSISNFGQAITCYPLALSDSKSTKTIQIEDAIHSGIASISNDNDGMEIQCTTLDSLNINNIDFIKIDVEGHEAEMLKGAQGSISQFKPYIIFENWINTSGQQDSLLPIRILAEAGYHFFHPAWQDSSNGVPTTKPPVFKEGDTMRFILTEFDITQRHLLKKQVNIFACHEERISELTKACELTNKTTN